MLRSDGPRHESFQLEAATGFRRRQPGPPGLVSAQWVRQHYGLVAKAEDEYTTEFFVGGGPDLSATSVLGSKHGDRWQPRRIEVAEYLAEWVDW